MDSPTLRRLTVWADIGTRLTTCSASEPCSGVGRLSVTPFVSAAKLKASGSPGRPATHGWQLP